MCLPACLLADEKQARIDSLLTVWLSCLAAWTPVWDASLVQVGVLLPLPSADAATDVSWLAE